MRIIIKGNQKTKTQKPKRKVEVMVEPEIEEIENEENVVDRFTIEEINEANTYSVEQAIIDEWKESLF